MKASDITDGQVLAIVNRLRQVLAWNWTKLPRWVFTHEIQAELPDFPPKVVLAKLKSLLKRKVLEGCACGCRGDWTYPDPDFDEACKPAVK